MLLRESGGGFGPSGGGRTNYHHFSSTIILLLFLFHFLFHFHFGGQWMPPENQPVRIPPHFQSMDNSKHPSSILFTKNPDESALPAEILQDSSRFFKILQDSSRFFKILRDSLRARSQSRKNPRNPSKESLPHQG